ncbi:extracellular calcium-sensing receptor-like [Emydura macquarii macquarii]|uniref:extracellular calcium-sensing receptor-like n=1 Tax=Emydura macquarii macquarii TaxID=1129001 RepID=UPI00352A9AF2
MFVTGWALLLAVTHLVSSQESIQDCDGIWEQEGDVYVLGIFDVCFSSYFRTRFPDSSLRIGYKIVTHCEMPPKCSFFHLKRIWDNHESGVEQIITLIAPYSMRKEKNVNFFTEYFPTVFIFPDQLMIYSMDVELDGDGAVETLMTLVQFLGWNVISVIQNNEQEISDIAKNFTQKDKDAFCLEIHDQGSGDATALHSIIMKTKGNVTVIFDYNGDLRKSSLVESVPGKQVILCCFWSKTPFLFTVPQHYDGIMSLHKRARAVPGFLEYLQTLGNQDSGEETLEYVFRQLCYDCEVNSSVEHQICFNYIPILEINLPFEDKNCTLKPINVCATCLRRQASSDVVYQLASFFSMLQVAIDAFCKDNKILCAHMGNSNTFKYEFEDFVLFNYTPLIPPNWNSFDVFSWTVSEDGVLTLQPVNAATWRHSGRREELRSSCLRGCQPGQRKTPHDFLPLNCCYNCDKCEAGTYSNGSAVEKCWPCPLSEWSENGSASCWPKSYVYLAWSEPISLLLASLTVLGLVLTLSVLILYVRHGNTPIVQAAGGFIFYCNMAGFLCAFSSTLLVIGEPTSLKCKLQKPVFGISFALCLSSVLAKTVRILGSFENPGGKPSKFQMRLYLIIMGVGPFLQCLICVLWVCLDPPEARIVYPEEEPLILLECQGDAGLGSSFVNGYLCFLAFCALACAMKSQALPANFSDAQGIAYAMMIFFVTWLAVTPVLQSSRGRMANVVLGVVILLSAYSSLASLFLFKCYVMLFRPERNTAEWIKKSTYEYCQKMAAKANLTIQMEGSVATVDTAVP